MTEQPIVVRLDKNKILRQLGEFNESNRKWKLNYDPDVDHLIFGEEFMSRGASLFLANDEVQLFMTPDSVVHGIFLEYFSLDYFEENPEFKPLLPFLENEDSGEDLAKRALQEKLLIDTWASVFNTKDFDMVYFTPSTKTESTLR